MKIQGCKSFTAALAILLITASVSVAQKTAGPNASATFSARTELVLVPAIVTDHRDKHVRGLTRDDFIVREDGVEQKIATFEEIVASETAVRKVIGPSAGVYSNLALSDYAPRRINIVVLDLINTKWAEQIYARRAIVGYLSKTVTTDQITGLMVLSSGGITMVHDFTTDTRVLVAALQKLSGEADRTSGGNGSTSLSFPAEQQQAADAEAAQIKQLLDSANSQLRRPLPQNPVIGTVLGFEAIANAFRGVPGRKALLWVTSAFPLDPRNNSWLLDHYEDLFRKLNAANIAIYPIDARGLVDTTPDLVKGAAALAKNEDRHTDTIRTVVAFAEMTGGRPFYNTNDLSGAMSAASNDSSSYYVLGYYAKPNTAKEDRKEGWRKLTVKVQRQGLNVRARSGYYAARETMQNPEEARKRDIAEALDTPFDFTGVPFTIHLVARQTGEPNWKGATFDVAFEPNSLSIDAENGNYVNFQLVVIARDAGAKQVGGIDRQFEAHLNAASVELSKTKGLSQSDQVALPAGEYTFKFVVRDNLSGRVGSVSAPVTVQ